MKKYLLLSLFIILTFITTACTPKFKPAEYASTTGTASPGQETQISLDDGASISIPKESINGDVSVKIERNPEKAKTLPSLPDGFVQVSDFYNFEVTNGELAESVDLTLPFNEKLIPSGKGILMFLILTADGWEAQPVENNGNKATIFTEDLGDPLIVWNFTKPDQLHICDGGSISVSAIPTGEQDKYEIVGRVTKKKNLVELMSNVVLGDLTIDIEAKSLYGTTIQNFSVLTKSDGTFSVTLDLSNIPEKNLSVASRIRVAAIVQCKPKITTPYTYITKLEAYNSFYIYPATAEQPVPPQPTQPPASQPQPIAPPKSPTDKIPVPNVVGMTFEGAQKTLEDLGFNTTWIDGKSNLELGKIYSQAPGAGTLSVPHRTTVVIYRTTQVMPDNTFSFLGQWSITWAWGSNPSNTGILTSSENNALSFCYDEGCENWTWKISGNEISWTFIDKEGCRFTYTGKINGSSMDGTMVACTGFTGHWQAVKK